MPERPPSLDTTQLKRNIEWALGHAFEQSDLLPMVEALAKAADPGSQAWVFAQRHLAELIVEHDPWRAAIAARAVAERAPDDDGARALQGLALTLLGHYKLAVRAYRAALALAPSNPWYIHNLGHLLDVALERPHEAVPLLRRAHKNEPHVEIASSLAHALARVGKVIEAKDVLIKALRGCTPSRDQAALLRWLEQGAPSNRTQTKRRQNQK